MPQTTATLTLIYLTAIAGRLSYSAMWTMDNQEDATYLNFDLGSENYAKADITYIIMTMTGSWILIFW